ncbi:MAG: nuclear transport factor 2 family protein [Actinobacteria bacterium]|jgi:3-phenylpropionate/cinnamic acid dioxygenase small subunit|nr:nuclear transport factor 2 family protein [Actinomycetota bacterium]MBU2110763.1 nuclear transport factor 2 family protein [Actinomycetota bacterium]
MSAPYAAGVPTSSADSARQIENLLHTYAELIDAGDLDGVADLFAHGRIHGEEGGGPETVFEGREGVRKLYGFSTRIYEDTGTPRTKHVTTNAIIDVDEESGSASCRSYFTVLQATDALALQPIIAGRYRDTFHRPDGTWWFESRTMHVDLVGDLSHHLKW